MNGSQTLISWNFENWLTVILMWAVGFLILGAVGQGLRKVVGAKGAPNTSVSGAASNVLPMSPYMTRQNGQ